jgi:hypothetical protein
MIAATEAAWNQVVNLQQITSRTAAAVPARKVIGVQDAKPRRSTLFP